MEEPFGSSLSASDSTRWVLRIALALLLGLAIWGLVESLTSHLIVPLIARVMGNDPNSPLYLGKEEIDVPAVFVAIVELCLAGIVAVIMNSWMQKAPGKVPRSAASVKSLSLTAPPAAPVADPKPQAAPATVSAPPPVPLQAKPVPAEPPPVVTPTKPTPPPARAKKPAKPKEVYYNIVGEPISTDDE